MVHIRISVDVDTINVSEWDAERLATFFKGLAIAQSAIEGAEEPPELEMVEMELDE